MGQQRLFRSEDPDPQWEDMLQEGIHIPPTNIPSSREEYFLCLCSWCNSCTQEENKREETIHQIHQCSSLAGIVYQQNGRKMPHVEKIHLPHFLTKKDVYDRMRGDVM